MFWLDVRLLPDFRQGGDGTWWIGGHPSGSDGALTVLLAEHLSSGDAAVDTWEARTSGGGVGSVSGNASLEGRQGLQHLSGRDDCCGAACCWPGVTDHGCHGCHGHGESWVASRDCWREAWVAASPWRRGGIGRCTSVERVKDVVQICTSRSSIQPPIFLIAEAEDEEQHEDDGEAG